MSRRGRAGAAAVVVAVALVVVPMARAALAHAGEEGSARELVLIAIAVLEVHPAPAAAVDDKIHDAQEAGDTSGVRLDLVRSAGEALDRDDVTGAKRLLEQSVGACPDADVLYATGASARPPCTVPDHALARSRRAVGGTSEVVLVLVAAVFAIGGALILRHPRVRHGIGGAS